MTERLEPNKLTAEEALEIAIELWDWMAETGAFGKRLWPGWKKYKGMLNECPLCEYVAQNFAELVRACQHCPLYGKWGQFQVCDGGDSLYNLWKISSPEKRKAHAKAIADLARKELARLRNNKLIL